MSDIGLNLSGIIALLVFACSGSGFALLTLISFAIASIRRLRSGGLKKQGAYGFFVTACSLAILNLVLFAVFAYFVDSMDDGINNFIDKAAVYAWVPFQIIVWITSSILFIRLRK